jgi:serine/threonine-protein kinase
MFRAVAHYMAPEQWLGQPIDARSNLFSLGAILYEMMTEQKAFDGANEDEVKQMILEGEPVPPHQINNKISLDVSGVIMKALSKKPEDRFASGQELVTALEGHKEPTTVATPAKKAAAQPPKGINIPNKEKPARGQGSQPNAPATTIPAEQPAATKSVVIQTSPKQAAAAAAGWGGTGTGSPASESRSVAKVQPTGKPKAPAAESVTDEQSVMSSAGCGGSAGGVREIRARAESRTRGRGAAGISGTQEFLRTGRAASLRSTCSYTGRGNTGARTAASGACSEAA